MFIDFTQVELVAGNGGPRAIIFRREKFIPKGGPNGGDGGRGGDITFIVNTHLNTLQDIRYQRIYKAERGQPGQGGLKTGRNGKDIRIAVPAGTIIKNSDTGEIVADLTETGQEEIICKGGKGGLGNVHFKSSTRQTPRYAQPGLPGETGKFDIELKVLADVGLVGLPNAGKSTLISSVSAAKPKIADYPFTTLQPHLGIVKYGEYKSFVMADIPGLIEGASSGKGLGHQFLKHIERTKILIYIIDVNEPEPQSVFDILYNELKQFNPDMGFKKHLIIRSKMDTVVIDQKLSQWESFSEPTIDISSVTHSGIKLLINSIVKIINES